MSTVIPTTSQRRPALIPPDVHLSSEDEQSLVLRIGSLQMTSSGNRAASSKSDSIHNLHCSRTATHQRPRIDEATYAKSVVLKQGSKRKASITAEDYQQLIYTVEKTLVSELDVRDQPMAGDRSISRRAILHSASEINRISTSEVTFLESEDRSLSPKDRAGMALHDTSFNSR